MHCPARSRVKHAALMQEMGTLRNQACIMPTSLICALQIVHYLDIGITAIFGIEALLKIIAFNFGAYIRVSSNKVGKLNFLHLCCFYKSFACSYDFTFIGRLHILLFMQASKRWGQSSSPTYVNAFRRFHLLPAYPVPPPHVSNME